MPFDAAATFRSGARLGPPAIVEFGYIQHAWRLQGAVTNGTGALDALRRG
jgi:arginase family enzyme